MTNPKYKQPYTIRRAFEREGLHRILDEPLLERLVIKEHRRQKYEFKYREREE
jgi:hypothetical protein